MKEKRNRGGGGRDRKRRFNTNTIQQLSVGQPPTVAEWGSWRHLPSLLTCLFVVDTSFHMRTPPTARGRAGQIDLSFILNKKFYFFLVFLFFVANRNDFFTMVQLIEVHPFSGDSVGNFQKSRGGKRGRRMVKLYKLKQKQQQQQQKIFSWCWDFAKKRWPQIGSKFSGEIQIWKKKKKIGRVALFWISKRNTRSEELGNIFLWWAKKTRVGFWFFSLFSKFRKSLWTQVKTKERTQKSEDSELVNPHPSPNEWPGLFNGAIIILLFCANTVEHLISKIVLDNSWQ